MSTLKRVTMQQDREFSLAMLRPTQDTDISSSLALRANETEESRLMGRRDENSAQESLPWLESFDKMLSRAVGSRSYCNLQNLLSAYLRNISSCSPTRGTSQKHQAARSYECYTNVLSSLLIGYQKSYIRFVQRIADNSPYLDNMSEIVGLYMDTELEALRMPDTESLRQVAAKLLAALYVYLDNSEEHILRVLLRRKLPSNKCRKIYESTFNKCCSNMGKNCDSISDLAYVRYLLVLKLWKRTCDNADEKKRIDKIAMGILGPRVPNSGPDDTCYNFLSFMRQKSDTARLMKEHSFDLRTACDDFIKLETRINTQYLDGDTNGFS